MQEFTSFEFYKAKNTLPSGNYRVNEDDGSVSIAMIDSDGCIKWKDIVDFEQYEHECMEDIRWVNDGVMMILGHPEDDEYFC